MKPVRTELFNPDISHLESKASQERLIQFLSVVVSVSFPLAAVLIPGQAKADKLWELLIGCGVGSASSFVALKRADTEQRLDNLKFLQVEHEKGSFSGEFMYYAAKQEINRDRHLSNELVKLPLQAQYSYGKKFNVFDWLPIAQPQPQKSAQPKDDKAITVKDSWFYSKVEFQESKEKINLDWLKRAAVESCLIAGRKGGGKSHLMRYLLLAFIEQMGKDDHFFIIDPHRTKKNPWILGVDESKLEAEGKIINKAGAMNAIDKLSELLLKRIEYEQTVDETNSRIRIFIDELDSFRDKKEQEKMAEFIRLVESEGRKYGFTAVIGTHVLKKGETGLDSSVVGQMLQILFAGILLDKDSSLPGGCPSLQKLKNLVSRYAAAHPKTERIVGIVDDYKFDLSHIPDLDLTAIQVEDEEDVETTETVNEAPIKEPKTGLECLIEITKWYFRIFDERGHYPNDATLRQAWLELKGEELSEQALSDLRKLIHKYKEKNND